MGGKEVGRQKGLESKHADSDMNLSHTSSPANTNLQELIIAVFNCLQHRDGGVGGRGVIRREVTCSKE